MAQLGWTVAGPLLLFAMMTVVGLELTGDDFRRVSRNPRVVLLGTLAQWTLLPAAAALLLWVLELEPHLAAGLILLTAAPGGGMSNVVTYLGGAHIALSVTLTAVTSVASAVVLPLLTAAGFALFVGEHGAPDMPLLVLIGQLVLFVMVPILLGMRIRRRRPDLARRWARPLRNSVLTALVVLVVAGIAADDTDLSRDVPRAVLPALLWTVVAFAAGWATAVALRLDAADRFTLATEFSVKNVGLAAIVALSAFERPELAVFSAAYIAVGYPLAALAAVAFRRLSRPETPQPAR